MLNPKNKLFFVLAPKKWKKTSKNCYISIAASPGALQCNFEGSYNVYARGGIPSSSETINEKIYIITLYNIF